MLLIMAIKKLCVYYIYSADTLICYLLSKVRITESQ